MDPRETSQVCFYTYTFHLFSLFCLQHIEGYAFDRLFIYIFPGTSSEGEGALRRGEDDCCCLTNLLLRSSTIKVAE